MTMYALIHFQKHTVEVIGSSHISIFFHKEKKIHLLMLLQCAVVKVGLNDLIVLFNSPFLISNCHINNLRLS